MELDERVASFMDEVGIKYIKNAGDFVAGLARRTDRTYAKKVADELNARASGGGTGQDFYHLKNSHSLAGSIYISSAFDGGVFRHTGNIIAKTPEIFTGKILDLGCDCGINSCFIAKTYPNCTVIAVDKNELAVERGTELAKHLGLTNISFVKADVLNDLTKGEYDTVTSFRTLLDVCSAATKSLPFFGPMEKREAEYSNAFKEYAAAISVALKDGGNLLSVERYTADYGWLGWMMALENVGLKANSSLCAQMTASDIASVKAYSVTVMKKGNGDSANDAYKSVMSQKFKSGCSCEGAQAEFALYNDMAECLMAVTICNKDNKHLHQFAVIRTEKDKIGLYEAHSNTKRIKYSNIKKKDVVLNYVNDAVDAVDKNDYIIETTL